MAKRRAWVLDSGTKGTGAEMVPLDKVLKKPAPEREPVFVPPEASPADPPRRLSPGSRGGSRSSTW